MTPSPTATPRHSQIVFTQPFQSAGTVPWGRALEHHTAQRHESVAYPPSLVSTHNTSLSARIKEGFANFRDGFRRHPGYVSAGSSDEGLTLAQNWYQLPDPFAAAFNTANSPLSKKLGSRHLQVIVLGCTIGGGLFSGSGTALASGGPGSMMICYSFVAALMWCTMQALAELAVVYPVAGSFAAYSIRFIDPAWGFAQNYTYALAWAVTLPLELVLAVTVLDYWQLDHVAPRVVWVTVFFAAIATFNLFGIRVYAEIENIFTIIKVAAIISFVILGIIIDVAGGPNGSYLGAKTWKKPPGPFLNGITGVVSVFVNAAFAYGGFELIGLAAAETVNPRRSIPAATKKTFASLTSFYLISLLVITFLVPFDDPGLTKDGSLASPFVIAIRNSGVMYLPDLFNAVILIAVLSVGNTSVYACSRVLAAIADQGQGPSALRFIDKEGRPMKATIVTLMFGFVAYLAALGYKTEQEVFNWLLSICGLGSFFTWGSICLCHIRFRAAWKAQGNSLDQLAYRSQGGLFGSYLGLSLNIIVFLAVLWTALFTTDSWKPTIKNFLMTYLTVPIVIVQYFGYKFFFKTKILTVDKIDLVTGCIGLEDESWIEERKAREADWPKWKKMPQLPNMAEEQDLPGFASFTRMLEGEEHFDLLDPSQELDSAASQHVIDEWVKGFALDQPASEELATAAPGCIPLSDQDAPCDLDDGSRFASFLDGPSGAQTSLVLGPGQYFPSPYEQELNSLVNPFALDLRLANVYTGQLEGLPPHFLNQQPSDVLDNPSLPGLPYEEYVLPDLFEFPPVAPQMPLHLEHGHNFYFGDSRAADVVQLKEKGRAIDTDFSQTLSEIHHCTALNIGEPHVNNDDTADMEPYWLPQGYFHENLFPPTGAVYPDTQMKDSDPTRIDSDATIDMEEFTPPLPPQGSNKKVSCIGEYLVVMDVPPKEQHGISADPTEPIIAPETFEKTGDSKNSISEGKTTSGGPKLKRGRGRPIVPGSKRQRRIQAMSQPGYVPPKRGRPRTSERHLRKRLRRTKVGTGINPTTRGPMGSGEEIMVDQERYSPLEYDDDELRYKPIYFILSAAQASRVQKMYGVPEPRRGWSAQDLRWQVTFNLQRVTPTGSTLIREITERFQKYEQSAACVGEKRNKENQHPVDTGEAEDTDPGSEHSAVPGWQYCQAGPKVPPAFEIEYIQDFKKPTGCLFPDERLVVVADGTRENSRAITLREVLGKLLDERDVYFRAIVWEILKGSRMINNMKFTGRMNRIMGAWEFV
ncbi:hypothetical protein DRE_03427 [Drechslerella stenobrocha 248]|uniref:Amino acid permease/ SLC12A domain-containing protein n=1 Tax=Drechslerella stenobrocha 248 TaxID=1043628 RepID=W7I551_9PEZI|nr:hypothetical protein DRE_03427 [Drechslerella stenobrocha 248]